MAYNYRKAEKEWLAWKQEEEEQLRALGVDEDTIQRLHVYDWEQFRKERNFYHWNTNAGDADLWAQEDYKEEVHSADSLLDNIEDEHLLQFLQNTNKQTLEIVSMKLGGFTSKEIAQRLGITVQAVDMRMFKFKRKIKNFL